MRKLSVLLSVLLLAIPLTLSAHGPRGGGSGFARGGMYGPVVRYSYGPAFGPSWYGPWGGWGMGGGFPVYTEPDNGQVKFDTEVKDAQVYIDGAYAGTVGELKSLRLHQGAYNLELRAPGHTPYAERIYVVNGKTLKVRPDLQLARMP